MNQSKLYDAGDKIMKLVKDEVISIPTHQLNILDVGFGDPGSFFLFFHLCPFNQYWGVDLLEEQKFKLSYPVALIKESGEECITNGYDSVYVRYCTFYNCIIKQFNNKVSPLLSEQDFKKIFNFHFEMPVQQYLTDGVKKDYRPNLLVLSNFLHCLNDKNEAVNVFSSLIDFVSDDCFIFIQVYTEPPLGQTKLVFTEDDLKLFDSRLNVKCKYPDGQFTIIAGRKRA